MKIEERNEPFDLKPYLLGHFFKSNHRDHTDIGWPSCNLSLDLVNYTRPIKGKESPSSCNPSKLIEGFFFRFCVKVLKESHNKDQIEGGIPKGKRPDIALYTEFIWSKQKHLSTDICRDHQHRPFCQRKVKPTITTRDIEDPAKSAVNFREYPLDQTDLGPVYPPLVRCRVSTLHVLSSTGWSLHRHGENFTPVIHLWKLEKWITENRIMGMYGNWIETDFICSNG